MAVSIKDDIITFDEGNNTIKPYTSEVEWDGLVVNKSFGINENLGVDGNAWVAGRINQKHGNIWWTDYKAMAYVRIDDYSLYHQTNCPLVQLIPEEAKVVIWFGGLFGNSNEFLVLASGGVQPIAQEIDSGGYVIFNYFDNQQLDVMCFF